MKMERYTAVIIGAGPAGHSCAVRLAQMGAKVAVVERDYVGGICTNWGCTPSKSMIESAKIARTVKESAKYGIDVSDFKIDFKRIAARRDAVIYRSRQAIMDLLRHHGVDIYLRRGGSSRTWHYQSARRQARLRWRAHALFR
jgi:dihydrolipoamide dehydrogenase